MSRSSKTPLHTRSSSARTLRLLGLSLKSDVTFRSDVQSPQIEHIILTGHSAPHTIIRVLLVLTRSEREHLVGT